MGSMVKKPNYFNTALRQPITFVCTILLLLSCALALSAHLILPDKTTDANRQIPEMSLQFPGTKQNYIVIDRDMDIRQVGFLTQLVEGTKDLSSYVPYENYVEKGTDLVIRYKGTEKSYSNTDYFLSEITHWAGTDTYGRDVLSRLILGLRVSLFVGFLSVIVSILVGVLIGSVGGYFGGPIDKIVMLIINTSWSIPTILMAFAIIIALGKGFLVIVLAVGLTMWVDVARIVRGQVLQIKEELFVKAGKTLGLNSTRLITRHVLPNVLGTIAVMAAANFATAILVEAGLSFLGLGIQPPTPSLGNMLQEGYAFATGGFVYLAFFPILTIMILVLCFNLLGTSLRDIYDVKTTTG